MKYLLTVTLALITFTATAQKKLIKSLDTITTTEQAEKFLETKKSRKNDELKGHLTLEIILSSLKKLGKNVPSCWTPFSYPFQCEIIPFPDN